MLLLAVLVIGALVWLFVAQPWRSVAAVGDGPASPSPSASATDPAPIPTDTADAADAPPSAEQTPPPDDTAASPEMTPTAEGCLPADIAVEALTDHQAYASGQNPQLSIRLTNKADADCTLNVGTSAQAFTISSGSDIWWRSTDCQTEPSDMIVLVKAGQQVTSAAPLTWDRTRSSTSTCQGDRPAAPGGGATYHLSVSIAGIPSSTTAAFQLY